MPQEKPSVQAFSDLHNNHQHNVPCTAWERYRNPCDSYHTQLASLINGATTVTDVALAWVAYWEVPACILQGVNKQLKIKYCFHPLAHRFI